MTLAEVADMPTCNLSESVHNTWLQMSGKKGADLFDATSDDLARAIIQISRYRQFFERGEKGKGPDRLELLLRAARRHGSAKSLSEGIDKYTSDFHDKLPHLEGEEHFGSTKRRLSDDLGSPNESHRLDTVNFSTPKLPRTLSRQIPSIPRHGHVS